MKIYSDRRHLPEGLPHCPLLYPFWGVASKRNEFGLGAHTFEHYLETGHGCFELTALKDADAAILPFDWEQIVPGAIRSRRDLELFAADEETSQRTISRALTAAEELAGLAAREGKPLVVFLVHHDEATTVALENGRTFRPSLYASRRRPDEYPQPFWIPDEIETSCGGRLPVREKRPKPVVGFCGQVVIRARQQWTRRALALATRPMPSRIRLEAAERLADPAFGARARALVALAGDDAVESRFILRDAWFNGVFLGTFTPERLRRSRREYFGNILESDYVLCARGHGNCSIRLYETLCCGRIPVFINTDCVLPYEQWIDWRGHCVWVDEADVSSVADKVAEFHERLSPEEFHDRQRACRRLWVDWLSPQGFFKNFHRYFR